MARGGKRQGTPGKAYGNRTDLAVNRAPQTGTTTAAAGGQAVTGYGPSEPQAQSWVTPDMVPAPTDPTGFPDEPLTTGMPTGPGDGPNVLMGDRSLPPDVGPIGDTLRALMLVSPDNAALQRLHQRLVTATTTGEL